MRKAIALARVLHGAQTDKAGEPYIGHLLRVMEGVRAEGEHAMAAAVLHDSIEDAGMTPGRLLELGYPPEVVEAVEAVSRAPSEEYGAFVERVRKAGGLAVVVKRSDLRDNMRLERFREPTSVDRERAVKYERALEALGG